ncbi:MAG TPA: hypothetical protein VGR37_14270 [Longimicrobiaceae bacterium]|nr:hypothetical protein [Longimicrobiaceae bacterium]
MPSTTPLLLALLLLAAPAAAQDSAPVVVGARIRLMAPELTRTWIVGRIIFADSTTVIIDPVTRRWGRPLALDQASLTRLQLSRGRVGSMIHRGTIVGGLAGAALGAYTFWRTEREEGAAPGAWLVIPIFAGGGAAAGAGIGMAIPREGWEPVGVPARVVFEPEGNGARP